MAIAWDPSFLWSGVLLGSSDTLAYWDPATPSPFGVSVRAATGYTTGKRYWEVVLTFTTNPDNIRVGVCNQYAYSSDYINTANNGVALSSSGKLWSPSNNGTQWDTAKSSGVVIGVAFDITNRRLWFSMNGVWVYGDDPAGDAYGIVNDWTGSGTVYAAASFETLDHSVVLRTRAADFSYPIPAGFDAYDDAPVSAFQQSAAMELALNIPGGGIRLQRDFQSSNKLVLAMAAQEPDLLGDRGILVVPDPVLLAAYGGAQSAATLPSNFLLSAEGTNPIVAAVLTLSDFVTLASLGGGSVRGAISGNFGLLSSGMVEVYGTATLVLPEAFGLQVQGTVGEYNFASLQVLDSATLAALGGGYAQTALDLPTISVLGTVGQRGFGSLRVPDFCELAASGTTVQVGYATLGIPDSFVLQAGVQTAAAQLVISDSFVLVAGGATGGVNEAPVFYAINLTTGAITSPVLLFDTVLSAHGRTYGVVGGTLYQLDHAAGQAVATRIRFAQSDLGQPQRKRPRALYVNGRCATPLTVDVVYDETTTGQYQVPFSPGTHIANQRCKLGNGVMFNTIGFTISTPAGVDPIDGIAALELLAWPLLRRI